MPPKTTWAAPLIRNGFRRLGLVAAAKLAEAMAPHLSPKCVPLSISKCNVMHYQQAADLGANLSNSIQKGKQFQVFIVELEPR